jgi:hypothetical protein
MEGGRITEKRSMHCPVLDDGRVDEGDPDLEVETDYTWFSLLRGYFTKYLGMLFTVTAV